MEYFDVTMNVIISILYVILLITLIVFLIQGIYTLRKANQTVEDVNRKLASLNNFFEVLDASTDFLVSVNDKFLSLFQGILNRLFKKKEDKKHE